MANAIEPKFVELQPECAKELEQNAHFDTCISSLEITANNIDNKVDHILDCLMNHLSLAQHMPFPSTPLTMGHFLNTQRGYHHDSI